MVKVKLVDFIACIGCETCEKVCEYLHKRPRVRLFSTIGGILIPITCMHCARPACMEACLTGAIFKDESGAVRVAENRCIGCKLCTFACPFSVPEIDPVTHVMTKCDLCLERRLEGLEPACSEICPAGVIFYGDYEEIFHRVKSKAAEMLARAKIFAESSKKELEI